MAGANIPTAHSPFPDVAFDGWVDGNTEIERTVTVTRDATYTAIFRDLLAIPGTDSQEITVTTQGLDITITGAENKAVSLYDIMGRRIAATQATECATLHAPSTGVYLLQIQGLPARKIVVR